MKIFEITFNDLNKQCVVASSQITALKHVISVNDIQIDNIKKIKEIKKNTWNNHWICDSYGEKIETFKDWIKNNNKNINIISINRKFKDG